KAQMQLYDTYCNAMFNIACRYLINQEDAKDAIQEGFLKAFDNIKNYNTDYTFGAWLKRIIINQCIDALRKQRLEFSEIDTEHLELVDDNDWNIESSITKETIINAIEELSEKHQLVIKFYLLEGYDHEEISQILDIPIKTSRTHLRRGRLQLQGLLKEKRNETAGY
ncbi:MAG: sigma-70 family RNA polymerase sigma factor, partial [Flavobacteriaceae bacterium]|nr:sigma-70 family RNA polymerase sigma factor [Flavobacteriaceae bacterium]